MTKYRLDRDPDTGKPCMVSDPNGIYYSTGEVDREVAMLNEQINRIEEVLHVEADDPHPAWAEEIESRTMQEGAQDDEAANA